ncbi:MAG: exodeoxyribonuclease VII small subunit [Clostridia bacterium]|nr:exodeoxyribonuclease VII small subunit [Clostridia bacterium]MBR2413621.1 exodeoxyribonuclease VII small subunit [Clostridia bacterium]
MPKMTYESAIKQLEEIVLKLEDGNLSLDESVKLFEKGAKLSAFCDKALKEAELKIMTLDEAEDQNG